MTERQMASLVIVAALLIPAVVSCAKAASPGPRVGDSYEITLTMDSAQHGSNGSSGRSHDKDTITERVLGLRAGGMDLEYDLPSTATSEERARNWQFPARIFKPSRGPAVLLNGTELEGRVDTWLKAAGWSRTACGKLIFTWNAFRIECDPQSVLKTIQTYDLGSADIREGAVYEEPDAGGSAVLSRKPAGSDGDILSIELPVDTDAVRRAQAESDVLVGELMKKPVSLDPALLARAREIISGTILVTFEKDSTGSLRRRTKVTKLDIKQPDGSSERRDLTETLERRLISFGELKRIE